MLQIVQNTYLKWAAEVLVEAAVLLLLISNRIRVDSDIADSLFDHRTELGVDLNERNSIHFSMNNKNFQGRIYSTDVHESKEKNV